MTFERASTLLQARAQDTIAVGLAAALVADLVSEVNVILAALCLIAFVTDFGAGILKMLVLEGPGGYRGEKMLRGVGKKIAIVFLWIAAALADAGIAMAPLAGLAALGGMSPTLKVVLLITLLSEVISITRNAAGASGRMEIAGVILRALRQREELQPGVEHGESDGTHALVIEEERAAGGDPP